MPETTSPSLLLVLASASPARLATLRAAGVEPFVHVSHVDEDAALSAAETVHGPLAPADVALLLARAKAESVARARVEGDEVESRVLGCDSVLELDGEVHGKPADAEQATDRWRRMRGRSGVLHTGHWVVDDRDPDEGGTSGSLGATASTTVHFADLDDDEIAAYVATGEPMRVAGAFTLRSRETRPTSSASPCPCCVSCWETSVCSGAPSAPARQLLDRLESTFLG